MLISERAITVDKSYDLEIRWHNPRDELLKIQFRALGRWSSNDVNPYFYDTVVESLDPPKMFLSQFLK
ncbi:hypothetical protein [Candidatus Vondammii sp. HM_W22]|uniref:hypothetical protein n=1 Tax=Candidatus Vondammii sp. HM_W22 TaxID=2687299 RepID=UPI002E7ACB66|nr:hypothetical protein [Candidatus Vondammii sp. HM_W22]